MNEIPMWWLILSALFFAIVTLLFVALCFLVVTLIKAVNNIQPQVTGLVTKVNDDLIPQVQSLVTKVEALTGKVDGIADSAKSLTDSAKGTVDNVGSKVRGMTNSVEHIAMSATKQFDKAAPIIGIAIAGLRLYTMFMEMRGQKPGKVRVEKLKDSVSVEIEPDHGNSQAESGTVLTEPRGGAVR